MLVVAGNARLREQLAAPLVDAGYEVRQADRPTHRITRGSHAADIIVLELGVACADERLGGAPRRVREWVNQRRRPQPTPTLLVAPDGGDNLAFETGAPYLDYLVAPFSPPELLYRVAALLGRVPRTYPQAEPPVAFGSLKVDLATRSVRRGGRLISLSPREWRVLRALASAPGRAWEPMELADEADLHGASERHTSDALRVVVSRLRRKIETDPQKPEHILTNRGIGYMLAGQTRDLALRRHGWRGLALRHWPFWALLGLYLLFRRAIFGATVPFWSETPLLDPAAWARLGGELATLSAALSAGTPALASLLLPRLLRAALGRRWSPRSAYRFSRRCRWCATRCSPRAARRSSMPRWPRT